MNSITNNKQGILTKLNTLLEVKHVFKSIIDNSENNRFVLIVILKGNCSSLTQELSSMVAKIFEHETDYLYRIFSFDYAQEQLNHGNLFFVHGCSRENMIFQNSDSGLDIFQEYYADKKTLIIIEANFQKECNKMAAFMDGATFFIEKENYSQAGFMLHQYIELWFRYAALFIMGKERKSHSIKELQTYVRGFAPELGNLFNTEIEEEQHLLRLLDNAYISTRYENNYHINKEQLLKIQAKADTIHNTVTYLFKNKLNDARKFTEEHNKTEKESLDTATKPDIASETIANDTLAKIKGYANEHFYLLKHNPHRKETRNIHIETKGYLDTSFLLANFLKVSIMALESIEDQSEFVAGADYAVQQVLQCALKLIPYEEMEFLDKVQNVLSETETVNQNKTDYENQETTSKTT
ncbi:HEPN domain-containing protein [Snuella lapsa]|uniref:HEPN domain-containing protein n=1 Tax=Snuella lapsa TaxID=870481 RepID=A0ABP6WXV2_9FLAO